MWKAFLFAVAILGCGGEAFAFDERCSPDATPEVQIETCGAVIDDPKATAEDRVVALFNRGLSYLETGDIDAAFRDLDRAVGIFPDDPRLKYFRGLVLVDRGDYARGIEDYDWILERHPDAENVLVSRSYARSETGDQWGAVEDCENALRLDPNLDEAYNNMAMALFRIGASSVALNDIELILDAYPENWMYLDSRAHILVDLGRTDEALSDFLHAAENGGETAVRLYQDALREKGFYAGPSDGRLSNAVRTALAACVDRSCHLLAVAGTLPEPPETDPDDVKAQVLGPIYPRLARAGLAEDAVFLSGRDRRTLIQADGAQIVVVFDHTGAARAFARDASGLFDPHLTDAARRALVDHD